MKKLLVFVVVFSVWSARSQPWQQIGTPTVNTTYTSAAGFNNGMYAYTNNQVMPSNFNSAHQNSTNPNYAAAYSNIQNNKYKVMNDNRNNILRAQQLRRTNILRQNNAYNNVHRTNNLYSPYVLPNDYATASTSSSKNVINTNIQKNIRTIVGTMYQQAILLQRTYPSNINVLNYTTGMMQLLQKLHKNPKIIGDCIIPMALHIQGLNNMGADVLGLANELEKLNNIHQRSITTYTLKRRQSKRRKV